MDNKITNNNVTISGVITKEFEYSHEIYGEKFYIVNVAVKRLSEVEDIIPVIVSERLVEVEAKWTGIFVRIQGQFRSYNKHEEGRNALILDVFAREIEVLDSCENTNSIFLEGYTCKPSFYRTTPLGREIADILVAVNRPYGKSDYIPCICWGRNARFASGFEIGTRLRIDGRIQSREYTKKYEDGTAETRIAYEVSANRIEEIAKIEEE